MAMCFKCPREGAVDFGGKVKAGDGYAKARWRVEWHHGAAIPALS